MKKTEMLRSLLKQDGITVAPGAYDAFSARMVEHIGFKVVYASGAAISASLLGKPDVGFVTMSEMVAQVRNIVSAVNIPVISDADTGYGNPMNVMRTVREFEQAGVAGIHIEDQELPKKCGHLEGKRLVAKEEMVQKIRAAIEARQDDNFVIIARTDAQAVYGLGDALERGHAYVEAGADMLFVESPESIDELKAIARSFSIPLLLNRGGKKTPNISAAEAEELGFKIVIFPGDAQRAAGKAMLDVLKVLKETGNTVSIQDRMLSFDERFELLGLKEYYEDEARFLSL
jgi:carboxyvinyl-carboxyphosphonate phosphorylmutase